MKKHMMTTVAAAAAVAAMALGSAAPAMATKSGLVATPGSDDMSWVMPDLIGQNLQDAQDAIQALTGNGVFFSGSTDLTGQGRNQVLDRNWQVCTSTPAPGEALSNGTSVEFGVVRIDGESCP